MLETDRNYASVSKFKSRLNRKIREVPNDDLMVLLSCQNTKSNIIMKKQIALTTVLLVFAITSTNANPTREPGTLKLSEQIQKLLDNSTFDLSEGEMKAQVRFTLNKEGEIVVLSVDTEDSSLEGFVKGRLNYRKVQLDQVEEGKIYAVQVRVTG